MKIKRLLSMWGLYHHRKVNIRAVIIFFVVLFIFMMLSREFHEKTPSYFCQSEINLNSVSLNKSGINVIPSTPNRLGSYEFLSEKGGGVPERNSLYQNECVDVSVPGGAGTILICIHDPKKDLMVSAHLKNKGAWEPENVEAMYEAHKMFQDMVLVDLGCNLGVFTLPAAKLGMEVIAVDSMMDSLKLLQRSLHINGLSCHVTLIHNALHRKHAQMRVSLDPTNIGGSGVVEILDFRRDKIDPSQLVDAICLDDLVPLVKGKTVFLKLDLEGNEKAVLECADQFFQQVRVKVLLLEWMYYRHNDEDSGFVKSFLMRHHMFPTWGLDSDRHIDPEASNSWPDNVFWLKRD